MFKLSPICDSHRFQHSLQKIWKLCRNLPAEWYLFLIAELLYIWKHKNSYFPTTFTVKFSTLLIFLWFQPHIIVINFGQESSVFVLYLVKYIVTNSSFLHTVWYFFFSHTVCAERIRSRKFEHPVLQ